MKLRICKYLAGVAKMRLKGLKGLKGLSGMNGLKRLNRRGFFAAIGCMLAFSVILLTAQLYANTQKELQRTRIDADKGLVLAYRYDDLLYDYLELLDVSFGNSSGSDDVWYNFSRFGRAGLGDSEYAQRIEDYGSFLGGFESLMQSDIQADFRNSTFNISTYSRVTLGDGIYVYPIEDLQEAQVELVVNQTQAQIASNNTPPSNGAIPIRVTILDAEGMSILDGAQADMKPNGHNQAFEAVFLDGSWVRVEFENAQGSDGVLYIITSGLIANVTDMRLKYAKTDIDDSIRAEGYLSITQDPEHKKSGELVLKS